MNVAVDHYNNQATCWPQDGYHILARFDATCCTVAPWQQMTACTQDPRETKTVITVLPPSSFLKIPPFPEKRNRLRALAIVVLRGRIAIFFGKSGPKRDFKGELCKPEVRGSPPLRSTGCKPLPKLALSCLPMVGSAAQMVVPSFRQLPHADGRQQLLSSLPAIPPGPPEKRQNASGEFFAVPQPKEAFHLRLPQFHHPRLPVFLKSLHVLAAEHPLQHLVAGRVLAAVGVETAVELPQEVVLLEVIAQIACLGVVRAPVLLVKLLVARRQSFWNEGMRFFRIALCSPGSRQLVIAVDLPVPLARMPRRASRGLR